jgi:chromosome segregation protein
VNVLLGEYQEAQQRFDFLDTQRQDLIDSIVIPSRPQRDRQRAAHLGLEETIRTRKTFVTCSAGYREMRLTDESNLADSGIDVVASPPGKRLQNVLLLSGGEKALTALALLMAVFQYQPSPFCILDEVDAPLDEAHHSLVHRLIQKMK